MKLLDNLTNLLSIEALEMGEISSPTQEQIDYMEVEILEHSANISNYIGFLIGIGISCPTSEQVGKIKKVVTELMCETQ